MKQDITPERLDLLGDTKIRILHAFIDGQLTIPEGMTVVSSLMIQMYDDLYPHETKEEYLDTMAQLYDKYQQFKLFAGATPDTIQ